jgi:hypothetical protein
MEISIRPLQESDMPEANRIFRLAFGTFLNLPDPMAFFGDADYVRSRFLPDPSAADGAEVIIEDSRNSSGSGKKKLVGSNFTTNWGSVGFFRPLTIHPDSGQKV